MKKIVALCLSVLFLLAFVACDSHDPRHGGPPPIRIPFESEWIDANETVPEEIDTDYGGQHLLILTITAIHTDCFLAHHRSRNTAMLSLR